MAIVIQIVGAVMVLAGLVGLVYGVDMLPTERGVAGTISSVTAVCAGCVTLALGVVVQRLDAMIGGGIRNVAPRMEPVGASAAPREDAPQSPEPHVPVEAPQRPRIEPRLSEAALIEPPPSVAPVLMDLPAPEVHVDVPRTERPKFSLPSFKLGSDKISTAAIAAGAAVAGVVVAKAGNVKNSVSDAVADTSKAIGDGAAQTINTVETMVARRTDPVDPPVEVLTPVDDVVMDLPAPAIDLAVYADVPMPAPEPEAPAPVVAAAEEDPFASFEAELDKLIPLKPGKKAKGKKDVAPEPVVDVAPETVPEPEPIAIPVVEPAVPAELIVDMGDLAPPQSTPAPGAEVVGAYESGGAKYTMYSDGSVVAEAEGQKLFFKSLEELREFIDGGVKG